MLGESECEVRRENTQLGISEWTRENAPWWQSSVRKSKPTARMICTTMDRVFEWCLMEAEEVWSRPETLSRWGASLFRGRRVTRSLLQEPRVL